MIRAPNTVIYSNNGLSCKIIYFFTQVLNPDNSTCNNPNGVCVTQLEAIEGFNQKVLKAKPDVSYVLTFGYTFPTVKEEYQSNTYQTYVRKYSMQHSLNILQ